MELHHLRYFLAVSEELHFGRAAQRLGMAQPPLSQRIIDLERELGVTLFLRRRSGVEMTEAGALLLDHARSVISGVDRAREAMRRIRPGTSGELRVGVPPDTNPHTLLVTGKMFAAAATGVSLKIREFTSGEQLAVLRSGEIDVGVIRHPIDTAGLELGPMMMRRMGVVMRDTHPASASRSIKLSDLDGHALVIFPRMMAPELYDDLLGVCKHQGFSPTAIVHARNPFFTQGLVLSGHGVHLNEEPSTELATGLVWRPLEGDPLHWRTSVCSPAGQWSELTEQFANAMLHGLVAAGHRRI